MPPLRFGTAGVRAPLGDGPGRMNVGTVGLVATAVARHLREQEPPGSTVVVGGDARHGSAEFVDVAAAVLAAAGFVVVVPGTPVPTPVVAAAVRARDAAAGLMVTASHNPPSDNGVKVFGRGGEQIVPPTDAHIEAHLVAAARSGGAPATDVAPASPAASGSDDDETTPSGGTGINQGPGEVRVDPTLVDDYVDAVVARIPAPAWPPRVALTPVHGVGGEICIRVLAGIGVHDVTLVAEQAAPDPDFPTVDSPNPERPQTTARLLELAAQIEADVALALDPDADRCAVGVAGPDGRWRMLDGDQTGAVLADHLLREPLEARPGGNAGGTDVPVVASTIVSSRLPSLLVPARGGRHVETLTGFKWLVRAGRPLRYAYEEAIGHCVLPEVVADKDGISAAAAWCAMVGSGGPAVGERLEALEAEFGAHLRRNGALPLADGADPTVALDRAAAVFGGSDVTDPPGTPVAPRKSAGAAAPLRRLVVRPLDGTAGIRIDVDGARAVIRPSGTEPLLKTYVEAWTPPAPTVSDRADAELRLTRLAEAVAGAVADG